MLPVIELLALLFVLFGFRAGVECVEVGKSLRPALVVVVDVLKCDKVSSVSESFPLQKLPPDGVLLRYGLGEADAVRLEGRLGGLDGGRNVELVITLRSRPLRPSVELVQVPLPFPRLLLVTLPVGLGHPDLKKEFSVN